MPSATCDAVERGVEHVGVHHLEVLDRVLEVVVVVVPAARLHVEDLVVEVAQPRDLVREARLDAEQRLGDLLAARAAELRQRAGLALRLLRLARELDLALAHLEQVAAALHERVDLRKDRRVVEVPVLLRVGRRLLDRVARALVHPLPLHAARDALLEAAHRALDVAVEDLLELDLGAAAVDDLVRDLAQQARQALLRVVEAAERPDHADAVEQPRQDRRDLLGLRLGERLARARDRLEELEVVVRLDAPLLDALRERLEPPEVG